MTKKGCTISAGFKVQLPGYKQDFLNAMKIDGLQLWFLRCQQTSKRIESGKVVNRDMSARLEKKAE